MSKTFSIAALAVSVLLALALSASADGGHGHGADDASPGAHGNHGGSMEKTANLVGAWTDLMAARDAIAGDVESGQLDSVHASADRLPELVAALLEQSEDLPASRRARVEGAANQVARVADALHGAADRDDATSTRKELSRLDGLLELIRAQYPAGALGAAPGIGVESPASDVSA